MKTVQKMDTPPAALLASVALGLLVAACVSSASPGSTETGCLEAELCDGETKIALESTPTMRTPPTSWDHMRGPIRSSKCR